MKMSSVSERHKRFTYRNHRRRQRSSLSLISRAFFTLNSFYKAK